MDQSEFHELTEATVNQVLDRIPSKYIPGFEAMLDGGEYSMAVEDLVLTLINNQVPATGAEQESLLRLLVYLRQPTTTLDDLTLASQT